MLVTGPTLTLRYATAEDAPRLLELASDAGGHAVVLVGPVRALDQPEAYIAGLEGKRERGELLDFLVVHPEDGPIGVTGLSELAARDRRATVGSWFGRELVGERGQPRVEGADRRARLPRTSGSTALTAWANTRNGRSQVALERVGFRREGVLRGWHRHGDARARRRRVRHGARASGSASPLREVPVQVTGRRRRRSSVG